MSRNTISKLLKLISLLYPVVAVGGFIFDVLYFASEFMQGIVISNMLNYLIIPPDKLLDRIIYGFLNSPKMSLIASILYPLVIAILGWLGANRIKNNEPTGYYMWYFIITLSILSEISLWFSGIPFLPGVLWIGIYIALILMAKRDKTKLVKDALVN